MTFGELMNYLKFSNCKLDEPVIVMNETGEGLHSEVKKFEIVAVMPVVDGDDCHPALMIAVERKEQ